MIQDAIRIADAAEIYGCSRSRIYDLINMNKLPSSVFLGLRIVSRRQVEELSEKNRGRREKWRGTMKTKGTLEKKDV